MTGAVGRRRALDAHRLALRARTVDALGCERGRRAARPRTARGSATSRSAASITVTSRAPSRFQACAISHADDAAAEHDEPLGHLPCADVASRLSQARISRRPSIGGIDRARPGGEHDRRRWPRARGPCRRRARRRPAARRPAGRARARASPPAFASHSAWPSSSQFAAMSSRRCEHRRTSISPVTAAAAPGTRRASASASPGRSNALLGMHAQ